MALLMEPGSEPLTEGEEDLDAIAAVKESAALEYKEQGNQFVKMGRKHYADAVNCYTKAIAQMEPLSSPNPDASVLFANRAHANLLFGNHRRALDDAEQAGHLSSSNVKAHYRAAKAALALDLLPEAASFCQRGLEQDPANEELKKFLAQVDAERRKQDRQRAKVAQAVSAAKVSSVPNWVSTLLYFFRMCVIGRIRCIQDLAAAIEKRVLRLGNQKRSGATGSTCTASRCSAATSRPPPPRQPRRPRPAMVASQHHQPTGHAHHRALRGFYLVFSYFPSCTKDLSKFGFVVEHRRSR